MNKRYCLIILLFSFGVGMSQNLVPNPSFEIYSRCPGDSNSAPLDLAVPWYDPAPPSIISTPDNFNACAHYPFSVPNNGFGSEPAHTGEAYAGFYTNQAILEPDIREYIRVQLTEPLLPQVVYTISFYVSLGDMATFGVETVGAYLSVSDTTPFNGWLMTVSPQIVNTNGPLINKSGWQLIRGNYYSPNGGERYLTIGNFNNDASSNIQQVSFGDTSSYYYIDDVSVTGDSLPIGTQSINNEASLKVFPNPFSDELFIELNKTSSISLKLMDILGREFLTYSYENISSLKLDVSQIPEGVYCLEVLNNKGEKLHTTLVQRKAG